jgi:hypothetical protein
VVVAAAVGPEKLLFVDECGLCTPHLGLSTATLARGKRLHLFGAQNPGQEHDLTLKYDRQRDGGPSLTVEGATTARVFEAYG